MLRRVPHPAAILVAALAWPLLGHAQAPRPSASLEQSAVRLGKAARLMQERLFPEAGVEFERALEADPDNGVARFQYAACLFAQGRNDEAREQFEKARRRLGDSPGLQYYLGRLDFLAGSFADAIRELRAADANPPIPQAAFYLGLAYLSSGNLEAGTKCLERSAAMNPRDTQAHYRLARAYSMADRKAEADKEYKLYREWRENSRATEEYVRACDEALHNQPIAEARTICRRIADPNDPERLVVLGQLYGGIGAFADAIEPLQQAVKLDPDSFEAWHNLGLSLFRLKRYQEARAPLERAAALNPAFFDTLNLLASTLYVLGDDAAALPVLERAHALKPDDSQVSAALEQLRAAHKPKR
jgi:tetratricopeptide (TPR) repeat protein